jgi:hypothetical protein
MLPTASRNAAQPGVVTVRVLNDGIDFFDICLCVNPQRCGCRPPEEVTTVL